MGFDGIRWGLMGFDGVWWGLIGHRLIDHHQTWVGLKYWVILLILSTAVYVACMWCMGFCCVYVIIMVFEICLMLIFFSFVWLMNNRCLTGTRSWRGKSGHSVEPRHRSHSSRPATRSLSNSQATPWIAGPVSDWNGSRTAAGLTFWWTSATQCRAISPPRNIPPSIRSTPTASGDWSAPSTATGSNWRLWTWTSNRMVIAAGTSWR